jgi:hypothetical protein
VADWLRDNPHVHFHFTPVGSSWINQIETWFGIITRQSIRRGTFTSVTVLVKSDRQLIVSGVGGWWAWSATCTACAPG